MIKEIYGAEAIQFIVTKPTMIITTRHANGVVNAGVFGAYTNLSAEHIGVAVSTKSHTYANIVRDRKFVINIPGADLVKAFAVIASPVPSDKSEIDEAGCSLREGITIPVPSIQECQAAVELELVNEVPVARHHFMIGRVLGGWIRSEVCDAGGDMDVHKANVLKDFRYPEPLYMLPGEIVDGSME
jgi:flavin reductase (DIM6/NTAB) family NADH-FMN oxidoreductase RutF